MSYTAWILLTASLVGLTCGIIGTFLILRRMAMMADAISHSVLLGIVVAFLITKQLSGGHMLIGSIVAGLLTAMLVQFPALPRRSPGCFHWCSLHHIVRSRCSSDCNKGRECASGCKTRIDG